MDDMNEGVLRVTNHQTHPTNNNYKVFFFYIEEQADYFEGLLKEKNIWYERDEEDNNKGKQMYLFGIKMTNLREVNRLNYLAIGKYRKPIFENKVIRYSVVVFGIIMIVLGIIGYFMSPIYQN